MKKNIEILIGTHNKGKFREISYLLSKKIKKVSPDKLNIKSPKETGKTFIQNSSLKANYFFKKSKIATLSDDSGLAIKCLKNQPGIHSARMAKKYGSFKKAMQKILTLMKNKKNRKAFFICSLSFKESNKKTVSVVGKIKGTISKKIIGRNGFGYDPIFVPLGERITYGQMEKYKKIKTDHRSIAFKKIKKKIKIL